MALMPDVDHQLVSLSRKMQQHDIVCIHTIVGTAPGVTAAHFTTAADGKIVQTRDTRFRSAANQDGNHRLIAIENEDRGPRFGSWNTDDGHAVPAFTPEQCESIARICAWAHHEHGIPLELAPDSRPGSRGIGYHRQGIDGNFGPPFAFRGRVPGGEVWTEARGKVCPGDRRIQQIIDVIIPRAIELAGNEEDELNRAQNDALAALFQVVVSGQKVDAKLNRDLEFVMVRIGVQIGAQIAPLREAIAALSTDPDITADEIERMVDESVAKHTPTTEEVVAAQKSLIDAAVLAAVDDDATLAKKIIRNVSAELPAGRSA